eukprot:760423-Hanusia_phi.AAC.2
MGAFSCTTVLPLPGTDGQCYSDARPASACQAVPRGRTLPPGRLPVAVTQCRSRPPAGPAARR